MRLLAVRRIGLQHGRLAWSLAVLLAGACGGKGGDVNAERPDAAADQRADSGRITGSADGGVACTLPLVSANLDRNLDLHLATLTGTLTLAGAPLPDSPGLATRGNVVLRERASGDVRTLPVGATGAATFSDTVLAGSYDVTFESAPNLALVGLPPAAKARLASAVAVTGSARLNYDLRPIAVAGVITAGGAALPDSPGLTARGNVVFRDQSSGDVRILPVGAMGAGSFSGTLFPGTYDVQFETVSGNALMGLPASAETRVATGVILTGDTTAPAPLAYDVQVASIAGTLTVGGAALPDSLPMIARGNLIFRDVHSGDVRTFVVPATGAASYSGLMFAGTYDVSLQTSLNAGSIGFPIATTSRLASGVVVAAGAASLGYDLAIANVTGTITTRGAQLPDSPSMVPRGSVRFVERTTGLATTFTLGVSGPATFGGALFAGTYDVVVTGRTGVGLAVIPDGSKRVATGVAVSGAMTLDYDVPIVTINGTITSGGAPLPSSPGLVNRGTVVFRDRDTGGAGYSSVLATGAGTFVGLLFASSYDVTLETTNNPGLVGLPTAAETRLASDLTIAATPATAPTLNWDAPVITLSGTVTLDGAPLPDSPSLATRGNVVFRNKLSGDARTLALPPTGPGTFSGLAFAGSYDVSVETASAAGLVGLPRAAETNLDVGCLPAFTCTNDPADLGGNWTFVFRDQVSWIRWNVNLTQIGTALTGSFTSDLGYDGVFDTGQRTASTFQLGSTQNTSTCVLRVDATVANGCALTGVGSCANGVSQSSFVGVR